MEYGSGFEHFAFCHRSELSKRVNILPTLSFWRRSSKLVKLPPHLVIRAALAESHPFQKVWFFS
jgi:hypothetical protein